MSDDTQMAPHPYDYDLFVIGGGSGGLAAAKHASNKYNKKVAVADFVKPSPAGTTWGLGGTCVNVGCIPKKLCHFAAQGSEFQADFHGLGWDIQSRHSWDGMIKAIGSHIKSLNWGNKSDLKSSNVKYYNSFATFNDPHSIKLTDKNGKEEIVTADQILLAPGGRPNLGGYEGAEECCISSDDIFWQKKAPGKTLVVGASYIALECAGFLAGLGFDTTVMVRSILLRGFDRDMADKIGEFMESHSGVQFARGMVPSKFEKDKTSGKTIVYVDGKEYGIYDTVLLAIGRTGLASSLDLEKAGLIESNGDWDSKSGKIVVDEKDCTKVEHIHAVGDIAKGRLELTPVAIQSGKLLVDRLFSPEGCGKVSKLMDYQNVATTVFTPLEFGTVGYSEDEAKESFPHESLSIYHGYFTPLEWKCNHDRPQTACYMKYICDKTQNEKIIGIHALGPNMGELIQGFAVALRCGVTREILNDTVGVHPTCAENMCDLQDQKIEGVELGGPKGC